MNMDRIIDNNTNSWLCLKACIIHWNIWLHHAAERNHKTVGVKRFQKFLNHNAKIIIAARQTYKCFVEIAFISAYAWNAMPIDGTDIIRSIPDIGRPLKFPMDIVLTALPTPEYDAAEAIINYITTIITVLYHAHHGLRSACR